MGVGVLGPVREVGRPSGPQWAEVSAGSVVLWARGRGPGRVPVSWGCRDRRRGPRGLKQQKSRCWRGQRLPKAPGPALPRPPPSAAAARPLLCGASSQPPSAVASPCRPHPSSSDKVTVAWISGPTCIQHGLSSRPLPCPVPNEGRPEALGRRDFGGRCCPSPCGTPPRATHVCFPWMEKAVGLLRGRGLRAGGSTQAASVCGREDPRPTSSP